MTDPSGDLTRGRASPGDGSGHRPAGGTGEGAAPAEKADLLKRALAFLIDGAIALVLSRIPWIGPVLGGLYLLLRDGFDLDVMDRRSLGKRLMRLRPSCDDGSPVTLGVSAMRNWTVAAASLAVILLVVPLLGLVLVPLAWVVGIVLLVVESYLTITAEDGRRWGDRLAGTRVVETDA